MPSFPNSPRRLAFQALVVVLSSAVWLTGWQIAQTLLEFTVVKQGITLVYVPAGLRLVILLISGIWGAVGIALAFPFALLQVFPGISMLETITYSWIAGFIPYAAVWGFCRGARISRDLSTLRSIHLPLLAAVVSVAGALTYTTALVAFGRFERGSFLSDVTAMAVGDFLGCFAVVVLVWLAISLRRKSG